MKAVNVAASSGARPRVTRFRYVERVTRWFVPPGSAIELAEGAGVVAAEPGPAMDTAAADRADEAR